MARAKRSRDKKPRVRDGTVAAEEGLVAEQHSRGTTDLSETSPFPIVGIGASAGGLEAFTQLLSALPTETGMAFVLVQHLDPNHQSSLAELLGRATSMPVVEASNGLAVSANAVYVIPPNANLAIAGGVLLITPRGEGRGPHLPVDFLFRALAEDQKERAVGVVLSGTGSDGTLGLCEIKAVGGITFAQDEESAKHAGMPQSAIGSGCVDFVMSPADIAARLAEVGQHPYLARDAADHVRESDVEEPFRDILGVVHSVTGVDFSMYRDTTLKRRILRRMAVHGQQSWDNYHRRLKEDRSETETLYHDLLINVTSFFRDPELFETLKTRVFPEMIKGKPPTSPIRVWIPGCSTGQEAYSIAISLLEFFEDKPVRPAFQIFATDLSDQVALDRARAGVYPESIEAEVSPERLRRFFKHDGHSYRIDKSIRDMCVFARHNVTADPPFSHVDLISCRNVLIYLSTPLQKRIFPTFHYALNPTGFLVLGTAETVGGKTDLFELVDRASKIYAKKPTNARLPLFYSNEGIKGLPKVSARSVNKPAPEPADYHREADRLLLGKYSPAGVLINEDFEVIQYRGGTSAYLEAPHGEPTTNVLKLAREGIFLPLRSAVNEARNRNKPVRRDGVQLRSNGTNREIALEVVPVKLPGAQPACFLVLFHDAADQTPAPIPSTKSRKPAANEKRGKQLDFIRLQQELAATKEYLQSLAEQQDAANEELRSANEEILSSNEELQSTNEELETAKEELQSANEELTTVNEQLQHRNVELSQLNNDMNNLMSSTHIPVVMVGTDLRIRRFTQPAKKIMNLLPGDIGRPISDIKGATSVADLDKLVQSVIETVQPQERVAQDRNGRWLSLRVTPYRTDDNRIDGAVLLLVDVDTQKKAEEVLREADRRKDEFLATLAHELRNPISPIVNAVETMRLAEHDAITTAEAREVLYRQVHQLSRIVEDMIDVSRIVEKKVELKRELVTLSTVVDIAVESCRSQMAAHRHHFKLELPDEPVFLYADPVRIAQILLNVLRNASKFTPPDGQIWLSAELERSQSDSRGRLGRPGPTRGMEVVIRIGDTGIGMTSELLPHVFDMFAQGDHRDSLGGLGVGLSLVRALVELHNGEVEAFSPGPDKGSEIVIRLPVVTDSADREPEQQNDTLTLASPTLRRRILVVDDNEDQADSLSMLLKVLGHDTRLAYDGLTAVELAGTFRPDIALIDIGLPKINGYEVARRIRENADLDATVLVAQTGWGTEVDRARSHDAGFDHHLVKPLDMSELQDILASNANAGLGGGSASTR